MNSLTPKQVFGRIVATGNTYEIEKAISQYLPHLDKSDINYHFRMSASKNRIDLLELFFRLGAEVNAPIDSIDPEGSIYHAVGNGALDAVRWLLQHGANVNHVKRGIRRCFPLVRAARNGDIAMVQLLVENGADLQATWNGMNALSWAIKCGHDAIEEYLRSKGMSIPRATQNSAEVKPDDWKSKLLEHVNLHLGEPRLLEPDQTTSKETLLSLYVVEMQNGNAIVTIGMSLMPRLHSQGADVPAFAELVIYLPHGWPLDSLSLRSKEHAWPIDWLLNIAKYSSTTQLWQRSNSMVFTLEEPPVAFSSNTQLSCMLAISEQLDFGQCHVSDVHCVTFFNLVPLYTEERDFEKKYGTERLIRTFHEQKIERTVNIHRINVATI